MNEPMNNTMTGNADNGANLRTMSGQGKRVTLSLRATRLWATRLAIPFTRMQFWMNLVSDVEIEQAGVTGGHAHPTIPIPPRPKAAPSDAPETDEPTRRELSDETLQAIIRVTRGRTGMLADLDRIADALIRTRRERDEAQKALEAEKALPSNLLDVDAICKQRDELLRELAEARKELVKAIEQKDGAFYLIEYAGELLGVKAQEHKSAHGFQVLQAIKDLIEKRKGGSHE